MNSRMLKHLVITTISLLFLVAATYGTKPQPLQGRHSGEPPVASCKAEPDTVHKGTGNPVVTIETIARHPDNHALTHTWKVSGGIKVIGTGPKVTLDTANLNLGTYTVTDEVSDGSDYYVVCSTTVIVREGEGDCWHASLQADPNIVDIGTNIKVTLHVVATNGDGITYEW